MPVDTPDEVEVTYRVDALLEPVSVDRRTRSRFPLDLAFSYRTLARKAHTGVGRILNISSTGALAECRDPFTAGTVVELTMEWPVRQQGWIPLHLVMTGSIVRCEVSRFVVAARRIRLGPLPAIRSAGVPVRIPESATGPPGAHPPALLRASEYQTPSER